MNFSNMAAIGDYTTSARDAATERREHDYPRREPFFAPVATMPPTKIWTPGEIFMAGFCGWTETNADAWTADGCEQTDNRTVQLLRTWFYHRHRAHHSHAEGWSCDALERDRWWDRVTPAVIEAILPPIRALARSWAEAYPAACECSEVWSTGAFLYANLLAVEAVLIPVLEVE